jgi:hypothetical protein
MLRIKTMDVRSVVSEADDGLLILLPELSKSVETGELVKAYEVAPTARAYFDAVASGRRRKNPAHVRMGMTAEKED